MKQMFRFAPPRFSKTVFLLALPLLDASVLQAQRGARIPVPIPQGGGNQFPDGVFLAIIGIIALVILVNMGHWIISCFRDFKSFSELLALAGGIAATWVLWNTTRWGFGWCLLAGYTGAVIAVMMLDFFRRQIIKRN